MKAASLPMIKKELETYTHKRLIEMTLSLARYKIENKEFLSYLLFDSDDKQTYVDELKLEINQQINDINKTSLYLTKKGMRKILRFISRYTKYMYSKEAEASLLIYFCTTIINTKLPISSNKTLANIYNKQLEKVSKLLTHLDDDLKFDYQEAIDELLIPIY
jgi:uncharacterized FlaG/YvyC family protein